MFMLFCAMILLSLDSLAFRGEAHASQQTRECVTFTLVFDRHVTHMPAKIYLDKVAVGDVLPAGKDAVSPRERVVCVEKKHARKFEDGTVVFIARNRIQIYNVWAKGRALKENELIPAFSSKMGLFLYEVRLFLSSVGSALSFGEASS